MVTGSAVQLSLEGKSSIVTGAGQGVGRGIALKLAEKGADVAVADINLETANMTTGEVRNLGRKAVAIKVDVASRSEAQNMVETAIKEFGKLDILVNNAGIARSRTLLKLQEKDWDEVLNVNVKGVFNCIQAVANHMIERRYGKIVNISSIYGRTGAIGEINYSASKAAIVALTKSVAKELARHNINVNAIMPGIIDTPVIRKFPAKYLEPMLKEVPLGRIGQPEDIGNVAAFLSSDESSFMTGAIIEVTGGWLM